MGPDTPPNFRGFERVTLNKVTTKEGAGTRDDVVARVDRYFDDHGQLVFTVDTRRTEPVDAARARHRRSPRFLAALPATLAETPGFLWPRSRLSGDGPASVGPSLF